MDYSVIIYYVVVTGDRFSNSLSVNKNIQAVSKYEAIGKAYSSFVAEHGDESYFIERMDACPMESDCCQ